MERLLFKGVCQVLAATLGRARREHKIVEILIGRSELKSVIFRVGLPPKGLLLAPFSCRTSKRGSFDHVKFDVENDVSEATSAKRRDSAGEAAKTWHTPSGG